MGDWDVIAVRELEQKDDNLSKFREESQDDSGEWQVAQRASKKRKGKDKPDEAKRVRNDIKVIL